MIVHVKTTAPAAAAVATAKKVVVVGSMVRTSAHAQAIIATELMEALSVAGIYYYYYYYYFQQSIY